MQLNKGRTNVGSKILEADGCGQSDCTQVFTCLLQLNVKRKTTRPQRHTFPEITGFGHHNLVPGVHCSGTLPHTYSAGAFRNLYKLSHLITQRSAVLQQAATHHLCVTSKTRIP